jgi:hypothetical protein
VLIPLAAIAGAAAYGIVRLLRWWRGRRSPAKPAKRG